MTTANLFTPPPVDYIIAHHMIYVWLCCAYESMMVDPWSRQRYGFPMTDLTAVCVHGRDTIRFPHDGLDGRMCHDETTIWFCHGACNGTLRGQCQDAVLFMHVNHYWMISICVASSVTKKVGLAVKYILTLLIHDW